MRIRPAFTNVSGRETKTGIFRNKAKKLPARRFSGTTASAACSSRNSQCRRGAIPAGLEGTISLCPLRSPGKKMQPSPFEYRDFFSRDAGFPEETDWTRRHDPSPGIHRQERENQGSIRGNDVRIRSEKGSCSFPSVHNPPLLCRSSRSPAKAVGIPEWIKRIMPFRAETVIETQKAEEYSSPHRLPAMKLNNRHGSDKAKNRHSGRPGRERTSGCRGGFMHLKMQERY